MTIKTDYILICENLLADDTGKLTIVNAFDVIYAEALPAVQGNISLVAQLIFDGVAKSDPDTKTIFLTVLNPSNKVIVTQEMQAKVDPTKPTQKVALGIRLNGLLLDEFGNYQFILKSENKKITERTLDVIRGGSDEAHSSK